MKVLVWVDHGQIDVIELIDARLDSLKKLVMDAAWYAEEYLLADLLKCNTYAEIEDWVHSYITDDGCFEKFKIVDVQ